MKALELQGCQDRRVNCPLNPHSPDFPASLRTSRKPEAFVSLSAQDTVTLFTQKMWPLTMGSYQGTVRLQHCGQDGASASPRRTAQGLISQRGLPRGGRGDRELWAGR